MFAKPIIGAAGALSLGLALSAGTVTPAAADPGAFFAGAIGGAAVGAIVGSAVAGPRYAPPPPPPVYVAPVEYAPAHCWIERRPVLDPYGYQVGSRPTRVCE